MPSSDGENEVSNRLSKVLKNELVKTLLLMCLVVIGVLVFKTVLDAALRTDYPMHTPISPSMVPTLNIGDLLIVEGVSSSQDINADPSNGDIIIFRKPYNPSEFVVHRAIEKSQTDNGESYFITKGDNNSARDPWQVKEDDIIGKVIWRIPLLGYIKIFLGTTVGMIVTIILFLILFLLERAK